MSTARFLAFLAPLASSQLNPPCAEGHNWEHLSALEYGLVTNSTSVPPSFQVFSGPGDFCISSGHETFDYVVRKSFDEQLDTTACRALDSLALALSARVHVELGEGAAKAVAAKAFNQSALASFLHRSALQTICSTTTQNDGYHLERFELCGNRTFGDQGRIDKDMSDALYAKLANHLDSDVEVAVSLADVALPRAWVEAVYATVEARNAALHEECVQCHEAHCRDCPQCVECGAGADANDDPTCQSTCAANQTIVESWCGVPDAVLV